MPVLWFPIVSLRKALVSPASATIVLRVLCDLSTTLGTTHTCDKIAPVTVTGETLSYVLTLTSVESPTCMESYPMLA